ncbi:hypothetical protein RB594_000343 [Gaeumannomyces avenae]
MAKKRRPTSFTKPQSTPPPSLASSRAQAANSEDHHVRGVNELLADLRRVRVSSSADGSSQPTAHAVAVHPVPSVPPTLRQILQLPETPVPIQPRSRRPVVDARGRRLPPGPAAPRSWLSQSRHAPHVRRAHDQLVGAVAGVDFVINELPGTNAPDRGSLMDIAMAAMAADWEFQRQYNKYWLYSLPDHLRQSLIGYIGSCSAAGVSIADLKALFLPPPDIGDEEQGGTNDAGSAPNENIRCLDLMGCLGKSIELKELSGFLFKGQPPPEAQHTGLQDSWDAPEAPQESLRLPLLPNLTRVSLAVSPQNAHKMSWRQLLSFSRHAGGAITHLSLAHWPEPTLTPNAIGATVDSPAGPVQYGGTGFYSHSLDDDWSEAVAVLKRLSKSLYGLEYLDLTGCAAWTEALARASSGLSSAVIGGDGDVDETEVAIPVGSVGVDWAGAWGKVTMLLLHWGYNMPRPDQVDESAGFVENSARAARIERHIMAMRRGRGRFIEVAKGSLSEQC